MSIQPTGPLKRKACQKRHIDLVRLAAFWNFLIEVLVACAWAAPASVRTPPDDLTQLSLKDLLAVEIDTVYSASRRLQRTAEAPSSVSIVTSEEIKKYGHRTLADILRSVRGIYAAYDRNYTYLGIRGFNRPGDYNSRTLLTVNGHRLNDSVYDAALLGTDFVLDVDLIERVEVVRGPSSSLYGNNAFFGVVNVVTKTGANLTGAEVSGEVAKFDTYKGRVTYGAKTESGLGLLLSGSLYTSQGSDRLFFREFDDPQTNGGIADRRDQDDSKSFFGMLSYRDFTLSGAFHTREKQIPTASFGTVFNHPQARTTDTPAYVDLKYQHLFSDSTDVMARVSYDRYHYEGDYPYDYVGLGNPRDLVNNHDEVIGEWFTTELQASRKLFDRLTLTLGAEYRNNIRQNQFNFDVEPYTPYFLDQRSSQIVGIYGQGEFSILTNLLLSAGIRWDHYDTFGDTANPRVGLIYTPWKPSTFKLLYGEAFRAPNVYELYYQAVNTKPSPDLEPEKIRTYELVYEHSLPWELRLSTAAYYYTVDRLISQHSEPGIDPADPADDILFFDNVDKIKARGIEFGLERHFPDGLMGRASYSIQRARDDRTDQVLSSSPQHLAKLNLIVPLHKDKLFAGLELQYVSRVETVRPGHADDFWIANATLFSQKLLKGLELSASVYNLFDERFGYPGSAEHKQDVIEQDGRSFRVKLTYRF